MKIAGNSPITASDGWFVGEDQSFQWTVYDTGQAPKDITGWGISFKMAQTQVGAAVLTKSATLTDPQLGVCTVAVLAADTSPLATTTPYFYTLARTDTGNNQVLAWGTAILQGRPA